MEAGGLERGEGVGERGRGTRWGAVSFSLRVFEKFQSCLDKQQEGLFGLWAGRGQFGGRRPREWDKMVAAGHSRKGC